MEKRFWRTRKTAKETGIPEHILRGMVRNGSAVGFFSGKVFYHDVDALLARLSSMSETRANVRADAQ